MIVDRGERRDAAGLLEVLKGLYHDLPAAQQAALRAELRQIANRVARHTDSEEGQTWKSTLNKCGKIWLAG